MQKFARGYCATYNAILCGRSTQIEKTQEEIGRLREVKTFKAGAIQDFGDLLKADDFVRRLDVSSEEQWTPMTPWLKRDNYGINVFPSIHASTIVEACRMGLTSLLDSFGS